MLTQDQQTIDSVSDSSFKFELPYVITMPENTIFFITDGRIPHLWGTIHTDVNGKLYASIGSSDPMMSYITTWRGYIGQRHQVIIMSPVPQQL